MVGENIGERAAVPLNWGNGEPTGTVAEIRTASNLQVEYNGKVVYKDLGAPNPDVRTEQSDSDLVQRAIELTALENAIEDHVGLGGSAENGQQPVVQEHVGEPTGEANGKPAPKKRASRKKSTAAAAAGEKRERADEEKAEPAATMVGATEQEVGEQEIGKKTKRGRTTKAESAENKKPRGRARRASIVKNVPQEGDPNQVDANAGQVGEGEEAEEAPKKRGPGRPRKSDIVSAAVHHTPVNGNAPAANTRSRNE